MRSFFVQIFLAFWASTIAIFVAANLAFPRGDFFRPDNLINSLDLFVGEVARLQLEKAPADACRDMRQTSMFVFEPSGQELCGKAVLPAVARVAERARSINTTQMAIVGRFWVLAERIGGQNGGRFVAVLLMPLKRGDWFPICRHTRFPVSAIVTFGFAYLLTKPVRALRLAFRRFAGGEMSARLPVARNALRDRGGADIRTLMIDFNEMADRIQALVDAHKPLLRDV
jgi:two-component system sensor histidine kinase CpxA